MNNKATTFIKNFSYSLSSNLVALLISAIVILIVPKLIGVEDYGYWQLYLFYSAYVGFLHFGWNDGIYLRYGGKEYKELNKELFFSQFWMLFISQIVIGAIIISLSNFFNTDVEKLFIINMTVLCMLIMNSRYMLTYILEGTNRIKEYAQIIMIEKILYCCLIILFLAIGIREYKLLIIADIIGKLLALAFAVYLCKDIVFNKISAFYFNITETAQNISVGIKLMVANIASMFIIGIVRLGIERNWDISTFGKVSLTLSISSLLMLLINAVGIIMFPVLRRTDPQKLPEIYLIVRTFLMIPLLGLLIIYFPLKVTLIAWLPEYEESLIYMALIFPMCVYEGKITLLINTYLKTLRKEKTILVVNVMSMALSIFLTLLFTVVFQNLFLAILSIVILLAFRCIVAEILLAKILNISVRKDIVLEIIMTIVFILTGWFMTWFIGVVVYSISYAVYLFIMRKDIKLSIIGMKQLVRKTS